MLIFSGATPPYEVMPAALQKVADVLPLTQGIKLLKATSLGLPCRERNGLAHCHGGDCRRLRRTIYPLLSMGIGSAVPLWFYSEEIKQRISRQKEPVDRM